MTAGCTDCRGHRDQLDWRMRTQHTLIRGERGEVQGCVGWVTDSRSSQGFTYNKVKWWGALSMYIKTLAGVRSLS